MQRGQKLSDPVEGKEPAPHTTQRKVPHNLAAKQQAGSRQANHTDQHGYGQLAAHPGLVWTQSLRGGGRSYPNRWQWPRQCGSGTEEMLERPAIHRETAERPASPAELPTT